MIFAQLHGSRTFIGCVDFKSELVASIKALCAEKGIECGYVTGYGYLENPALYLYSRSEKKYLAAQPNEGLFLSSSVSGAVSLGDDGKLDVQLFCQASASDKGRVKTIAGQIASATVRQFEFVIVAVDNLLLKRAREPHTGLQLWLQALPTGLTGSPPPAGMEKGTFQDELIRQREEEVELGEEEPVLKSGDWLDHPRLGPCYVISYDGAERIKVKLQSGRIAELLMSMFRLSLAGVREGGHIYAVEMRKRR